MSLRTERVASLVKEEVGMLFTRNYRDPEYGFITITEVHMTPDLRMAKIYVSVMGNSALKEKTLRMLEDHKKEIRSFIASHIRLKFTPTVQFYLDETFDRIEKINKIIKQIHKDDQPH